MSPLDQASRIVRERDLSRLRAMGVALALSACLVVSALGVVGLRVQQVRLSYRLDALRAAKVETGELNRQLRIELATLRSPARIEAKALAELGMAPPAPHQIRLAREFTAGSEGSASRLTAWDARRHDAR
ncbi:MAG: cell division protein FtsL [Candidatus Rokubacteria bacterium]|nr:cell division protein FtsL [Candidatus Rokubacteria bacterium]